MAISFWRAEARARSRLATLMHATIRTKPTRARKTVATSGRDGGRAGLRASDALGEDANESGRDWFGEIARKGEWR